MCGRYTLIANAEAIRVLFEVPAFDARLLIPRYNIAPTQPIVVVRRTETGRELLPMRWGFIPATVKDPRVAPLHINARAESIASRPSFRGAFRYRRCLVPASAFYEWQAQARGPKLPFVVRRRDDAPIAFAGIWETWMGADGSEIDTAAIVTTDANDALRGIHSRMPVVIDAEDFETWLAPYTEPSVLTALLRSAPDDLLTATPVSARVNTVANDDPSLLDPPEAQPDAQSDPRQGSLF